jgi:ubiquinol-cytochrome c reductase cytochrome b subunit
LGACHVETPFIELGQISSVLYFSYFIIILPAVSIVENTLIDLCASNTNKSTFNKLTRGEITKKN